MKPIRKNELEYLDKLIRDKFQDRSREIKSAIEAEAQKQTDKNYKSFVEKLGLKAEIKAFKEAEDKLKKFVSQKESYEAKLYSAKQTAASKLESKLNSWSSIRGQKGITSRKEEK